MNWDYRVINHDGMFTIHEVSYNDKGDITSISQDPMGPSGDTLEELKDDMEYFLQALDMPVLKKEEIVFASGNED
jgi:hypothetical protein